MSNDDSKTLNSQTEDIKNSKGASYTLIPSKRSSDLPRSPSQWRMVLRRFRKHKLGMFGGVIFFILVFCAIFADILAPYPWDPDITDNGPTPYGNLSVQSFSSFSDTKIFTYASIPQSSELTSAGTPAPDSIHFGVESTEEVPEDYDHVRFIYALTPFNVIPELRAVNFDVSIEINEEESIGLNEGNFMVQVIVNDNVIGNWTKLDRDPFEFSDFLISSDRNNIRLTFADIGLEPVKLVIDWSKITWLDGSTSRQMEVNETLLTRGVEGSEPIVGWQYSLRAIQQLSRIAEMHYGLPPFQTGTRSGRFHLLGTDLIGHDIFSGLLYGSRISLLIGIISMTLSCTIGVVVGGIAGYYGGILDDIVMRIVEIIISIPGFFLLILILSVFQDAIQGGGAYGGPLLIAFFFGILGWAGISRIVRAEFLSLRSLEYADAAKVLGASNWRIMFKHLLPNAMAPIIVIFTMGMADTILSEAGLSFLGLGNPATPSWGRMLQLSQEGMRYAWWAAVFPGLAIFITVLAFNLMGDALRDALDPRLKE